MKTTRSKGAFLAATCAALVGLTVAAAGAARTAPVAGVGGKPIVTVGSGSLRGAGVAGVAAFRGIPYAAPPVGDLRWRAPQPPTAWKGVRDATQYAPSCPQKPNLFRPAGVESENCLYLNVSTPTLRRDARR